MDDDSIDEDHFDQICDHLLVLDQPEGQAEAEVVGTYRLLRSNTDIPFDQFYTESEFDISMVLKQEGNLLELGRSCIKPEYRDGRVIQLLWRAIGAYVTYFQIKFMFGCASFHGTDPMVFQQALSFLHHTTLAPEGLRPSPLPEMKGEFDLLPQDEVNKREALKQLPPLLKGYMRLGCYVGEGCIVDPVCKTVDVCIVLDSKNIPDRYKEFFLDEEQRQSFPR